MNNIADRQFERQLKEKIHTDIWKIFEGKKFRQAFGRFLKEKNLDIWEIQTDIWRISEEKKFRQMFGRFLKEKEFRHIGDLTEMEFRQTFGRFLMEGDKHVAILGRNQTFHCIFQSCYHVGYAVVQNH